MVPICSDLNGCVNSTSTYILISGVDDLNNDSNISIYPNPSSGKFIVEWLNGPDLLGMANEVSIDIINTLGQEVFSSQQKIPSMHWTKQIDLSNVSRGVYFIEIKTENEFVRKKIVIAN